MKEERKGTWKGALRFTLCMLPLALIAGFSIARYETGTGIAAMALETVSEETFFAVVLAQTVVYALLSAFAGYFLATATGLRRSFRFEKRSVWIALLLGALSGAFLFALDYWAFARAIPQVADFYAAYPFSAVYLISEVFYGGVVEELLMRWLLMSLLALGLWKLFVRRCARGEIPAWVFVAANALVAVLFALGHLPATLLMFGELTPLILLRCMVLNASLGLLFGRLYRRHGIQYAMIAHALTHVVCDALLFAAVRL